MKDLIGAVGRFSLCTVLACGAASAADTDRCTYDFAAISKAKYEIEDADAPNAIPDPLGFKKQKAYIWHPDKKADLPSTIRLVDETMVAEALREEGLYSMLSPEKLVAIAGGERKAACLHNFAGMKFKAPRPGRYRLSCSYRGNHTVGTANWSAYFFLAGDDGKRLVSLNFPDTGEDGDYWAQRAKEFEIPASATNLTATLRLDGIGYLKVSKVRIVPVSEENEPELLYCVKGSYDGRFGVNAGDVEAIEIDWRTGKGHRVDWRKTSVEFIVPKGFSFVGFNGKVVEKEKRPDGTERVLCGCAEFPNRIRVITFPQFVKHFALSLLVRADGKSGDTGTLRWQALYGGRRIGEKGRLDLVTVPSIPVSLPKRYHAGAMLTYNLQFFPKQPEANRAYAEHLRRCGVDWLMPELRWMRYDPTLLPMWREVGFRYITPVDNEFYSNGYAVPRARNRPAADRFVKRSDKPDNRDYALSSCPAAIYEERPFFLTNFVARIAEWAKGTDGMWSNWEPFYFGGCYCDGCRKRLAEWKEKTGDSEAHFHSMQHGKICTTVQKHFKRIFGEDSPAFMPAICALEVSSYARLHDYAPDKRAKDYIGEMNWVPAWGPYVAWQPETTGPWRSNRGRTVASFIAAKDIRAEIDRGYPGKKPKIVFQPSGGNWMIQPEWLEITMDAALFNRLEACVPWVMPEGCDARLWAGFTRHVNRAARYEDAVRDGVCRNDATVLVPAEGFARRCPKPIANYMPLFKQYMDYPTLQQTTYDHGGVRYVAVMNFDESSHVEFTLKTAGLAPGRYAVVREDGAGPSAGKTYTARELSAGIRLSVPVSATRVFEIRPRTAASVRGAEKDFWFVVNEDNDHFFKCDPSLMTEKGLVDYIDYVAQGKVTHFFMCVNGQRTSYGSKTWEPIWLGMDEPARKDTATAPDGTRDRWCVNAKKLFDAGIDPYAVWIRRCREKSVSPWVSMRMNDVHFCTISNYFRNATFPRTRRDLWINPDTDFSEWVDCSLDYAHKEVRDYVFAQAEEMAGRWDSDGLELDWMRFGYALKPSRVKEDAHYLDGFVRDVRRMLDRVGAARGRRMGLAVRVPRDPDIARANGFDAVKWAEEGWVDVVIGHSFLTVDTGIAVKKWLAALEGTKARFVPGIDSAAPAAFGMPRHATQVTEYRGTAEIFQKQGATGVYVFNLPYNSKSEYRSDGTNDFNRDRDIAGTLYREGLSPSDIAGKRKAYLPVYHDYPFASMEPRSKDWRILAADRGRRRIFVMDGSPEGKGKVLKSFEPLKDPRVAPAHRAAFNDIDEAKLVDGGRTVIGCASSDAFFGFDFETEELLFYGVLPKNLHSIDRLPDGKFVGACSLSSDRLVLIDLNGHPFEPAKQKYTEFAKLHGAHGVVWDAERNCLFALGYTHIVRYAYDPAASVLTETGRWNYLLKDGDLSGHDFTPDGHGGYYFTVSQSVRHFDPETGEVRWYAAAEHAKSFHQADIKGDLYCIPNNRYWSDRALIVKGKNRREIPLPEGSLVYKFRWLNP